MTLYRTGVWFTIGYNNYTRKGYNAAAKTFESLDDVNVSGRSFMITGANSGIGMVL